MGTTQVRRLLGGRLRWGALLATVGLGVALTTGCSVESTGVTGVGIDASGELVGYIQMCSDRIDGATFYETDGDTLGRWNAPEPVTDYATWLLADPDDWTATQPYTAPGRGREYSIFGGTKDDSTSSRHVTFQLDDLKGMEPGEVLYGDPLNGFKRATETDFRRHACDDR